MRITSGSPSSSLLRNPTTTLERSRPESSSLWNPNSKTVSEWSKSSSLRPSAATTLVRWPSPVNFLDCLSLMWAGHLWINLTRSTWWPSWKDNTRGREIQRPGIWATGSLAWRSIIRGWGTSWDSKKRVETGIQGRIPVIAPLLWSSQGRNLNIATALWHFAHRNRMSARFPSSRW